MILIWMGSPKILLVFVTTQKIWKPGGVGLTSREKDVIKNLPNFDAAIFKEITGIDVDADEIKL